MKNKVNVVDMVHIASINLLTGLMDTFPTFKTLFMNSGSTPNDWDFFMTAAGSGIALMSSESYAGERNFIQERLVQIDKALPHAINDFNQFMTNKTVPDELIAPMAGQWVLWNIKKSQPTEDETTQLSSRIGIILLKIISDYKSSI